HGDRPADRRAGGHPRRHPARYRARHADRRRLAPRRVRPGLHQRAAARPRIRRHPGPVADRRGDQSGPLDPPVAQRGPDPFRRTRPDHALGDARRPVPGLHADRQGQGRAVPRPDRQARAAQCRDSHPERRGRAVRASLRRCGADGDDLRAAGARATARQRDRVARLPPDPGLHPRVRNDRDPGEPAHRPLLPLRRPATALIPMLSKTRDVLRHPSGMVGSILVGSIVLAILLGPVFYAYEEVVSINLGKTMLPPSLGHPLGTDSLGRDLLGRILWGGQVSLLLSIASVGIGLVLGTLVGALAGYFDGFFSGLAMRAVDALMTFPRILLALFIIVVRGQGTASLAIAIGLSTIPTFARITRGSTLSVRRMTYVEAAAAVGCSNARIIFRHVLPNIISPVIVQATLTMASAVILAAGLSFLG